MIIVTGCGRSGTYYMALALQQLRFEVGHEEWGPDGQVGFHAAVELKGAKINKPWRKETSPDDVILHQVRHPLLTISSFQTAQHYTWDFLCEYCPEIERDASVVKRCMQYWYYWNKKVEDLGKDYKYFRYQIEQIDQAWPIICENIGKSQSVPRPVETKKGWHKRGHTNLKWSDLVAADECLTQNIQTLAIRYGYEL